MKKMKMKIKTWVSVLSFLSFLVGPIISADDCCYDGSCSTNWTCWIGGALLGAAAGAGTGYAAGHHHGNKGKKGRKGETGPIGPVGPNGTTGTAGPTGSQGQIGFPGIPGINGINGINGQNDDPDSLINTTNALTVSFENNAITDAGLSFGVELLDPQGSSLPVSVATIDDGTGDVNIFSLLAAQPKFEGIYILVLTVDTTTGVSSAVGDFIVNSMIVHTPPTAVWVVNQTILIQFTFP